MSNKGEVFLTADTHFGHANIIKYCKRPFSDVHGMDVALIERWNAVVNDDDTVFHLGDVGFADFRTAVWQLNGTIILIRGNHDKPKKDNLYDEVHDVYMLRHGKYSIWLSHYSHVAWPQKSRGSMHLFGHSHGKLEGVGRSLDIGVDMWDYTPVHIETAIKALKKAKEV